ncbi:MAG TPA: hypothetical protein DEP07_03545 [Brevibacillus sp.]|jgi:hypothetical protein|uniref:Uncharacterized protein n=1 Tax=Brevibacillus parabrevis TaxID=54914 RepID=A0A4Y3PFJ3_BREPA|nr:hypothetical protein EDM60_07420 [Brevibacillus parabrevis]GEB32303.1 hypothetical protein BPA01_18830 [Brevibacillus parabrevis]HBZ79435.1 hypothetical protein [Brevibacillus sp.]
MQNTSPYSLKNLKRSEGNYGIGGLHFVSCENAIISFHQSFFIGGVLLALIIAKNILAELAECDQEAFWPKTYDTSVTI